MSRKIIYFCDKCKKEIDRNKIHAIGGIVYRHYTASTNEILRIQEIDKFGKVEHEPDLCIDCFKSWMRRILKHENGVR